MIVLFTKNKYFVALGNSLKESSIHAMCPVVISGKKYLGHRHLIHHIKNDKDKKNRPLFVDIHNSITSQSTNEKWI